MAGNSTSKQKKYQLYEFVMINKYYPVVKKDMSLKIVVLIGLTSLQRSIVNGQGNRDRQCGHLRYRTDHLYSGGVAAFATHCWFLPQHPTRGIEIFIFPSINKQTKWPAIRHILNHKSTFPQEVVTMVYGTLDLNFTKDPLTLKALLRDRCPKGIGRRWRSFPSSRDSCCDRMGAHDHTANALRGNID